MITAKFEGFDDLILKLQKSADFNHTEFFHQEFKPIAQIIENAIRIETPQSPSGTTGNKRLQSRNHPAGTLRRSIGYKLGGDNIPTVWISLRRKNIEKAWYSHIVVGGRAGNSPMPPNPIVRRAWDSVSAMVQSQLQKRLENKLRAML